VHPYPPYEENSSNYSLIRREVIFMGTRLDFAQAPTQNKQLLEWVDEMAVLTEPDAIVWCDGSDAEWNRLTQEMVDAGTFIRLNEDIPQRCAPL
jgi:GTP-dependent phosphoenolpyruvate carboxykinase